MKNILITLVCLFAIQIAHSQVVSPVDFLQGTDITQEQLKGKLIEKGIDLNNISPEDLPKVQGSIEDAIKEIEEQGGQNTGNGVLEDLTINNELSKTDLKDKFGELDSLKTKNVGVRLEDGASIEEAISEEVLSRRKNIAKASAIYGHSFFFDQSLEFYRTTQTSTPPHNYLLDVGDKITVNIFGRSQADLIYQIENDGFIRPSGMYKVYLKGVPYGKAKELLFKRFQLAYSFNRDQFNVDLNTARTVRINIYGEVNNPGSYTISALNSALSAVIAAGGPTRNGSVRNIKFIVNGKEKNIDLYEFISNPGRASDYGLVNNATIFVPPLANLVTLRGRFLKAGLFEMKEGETVSDLLVLAGGLRKQTSPENFNIDRVEGSMRVLSTYNYDVAKSFTLEDLDIVSFRNTNNGYENNFFLEGAIRFPGDYALEDNQKIADAIKVAILEKYTRMDIAYIFRKNDDGTFKALKFDLQRAMDNPQSAANIDLVKGDYIRILDTRDYIDVFQYSIRGAVRRPQINQDIDLDTEMRLSDAINWASGLAANATKFAYIVRKATDNPDVVNYKLVNLHAALENKGSIEDVKIQGGDNIIVPSNEAFTDKFYVTIGGAVRKERNFLYSPDITLKEAIILAGGISQDAQTSKVDIYRLVNDENGIPFTQMLTVEIDKKLEPLSTSDRISLQPGDVIEIRKIPNYGEIETVYIQGEVLYPGVYAITDKNERISDLIEKSGGLTIEANLLGGRISRVEDEVGVIITNFGSVITKGKGDIIVKDGDTIFIPKQHDIVQIRIDGTNVDESYEEDLIVNNAITVPYRRRNRASKYIKSYAGGFKKRAKRGQTYVQHKSGRMVKTKNFGLFRIYPRVESNSIIITTLKEEKPERNENKEKRDIVGDVMDFLALATSTITVIVLANTLK